MRDLGDHPAHEPMEVLEGGPSPPSLVQRIPTRWRRPLLTILVLGLGAAVGAGAVLEWQDPPRSSRPAFQVDEHDVELLLFEVVRPRAGSSGGGSGQGSLRVDGAVFLSGSVAATVSEVGHLGGGSLDIHARGLPVTISPTARFQTVELEIVVRDCRPAGRWSPSDRPFTITWQDEHGKRHVDRAGDFDSSMARSLVDYVDTACAGAAQEE